MEYQSTIMSPFIQESTLVCPRQRMEDRFETIDEIDADFQNGDKTDGAYYIGNAMFMKSERLHMLMGAISPSIFFKYNSNVLREYLYQTSLVRSSYLPDVDIVRLVVKDNLYTCIIKTFWIRIIQRRWKKICAQKMAILRMRGSIPSQRYFELYGKYPENARTLPGLRGMLFIEG